jgi:hypothetical protein
MAMSNKIVKMNQKIVSSGPLSKLDPQERRKTQKIRSYNNKNG